MVLGVDLGDDVGDDTVLIDDVSLAEGSHADLAVVLLLAPGLISLKNDGFRIGNQGKRQPVLSDELLVRGRAVLADTHHGIALAEKAFIVVTEVACLGSAAGSAVLG